MFFKIMEMNDCRGDLTEMSAKKEALVLMPCADTPGQAFSYPMGEQHV